MDTLILVLFYLPITFFLILAFRGIFMAIRFGEYDESYTKFTFFIGIGAFVVSFVCSCLSYKGVISVFLLPLLCILLTFFLKKIIMFFADDFDKKAQIKVDPDEVFREEEEKDFFDANERFNGDFTDYTKK